MCILSRGGYNNNPNVIQFRTAIKPISLRNSIVSPYKINVLSFEEGKFFFLAIKKKQTSFANLINKNPESLIALLREMLRDSLNLLYTVL